jgi:probable F420-dependent oxidoreductase
VTTPQLSIGIPNFGTWAGSDWRAMIDVARVAEHAGADRVVVVDHLVMGPSTGAYRWGRFPTPPESPWLEPLTVLTAMAAVTSTVRLATGILIAPLRPPALLAKTAATLDQISGGRLDLGVGFGWQREEYAAVGRSWDERGALLSDALAVCRALWTDTPASVRATTIEFDDIYCEPKPADPGGIPILVAGTLSERNIERIVRWGNGWIPIMGASGGDVAGGIEQLRDAFTAAGRNRDDLIVHTALPLARGDGGVDLEASFASAATLATEGVTSFNVPLQAFAPTIADAPKAIAEIVDRHRRAFA